MKIRAPESAVHVHARTPWEWRKQLTYAVLGTFCLAEGIPEQMPTEYIYSAFSSLKPKYPKWLGLLHFEISESATTCKGLEDILFSLGAFGLVTVENRDFRCLRFKSDDRKVTRSKMQERIAADSNLKDLEDLSNDFARYIKDKIKTGPREA